jgi:hypothetical protein
MVYFQESFVKISWDEDAQAVVIEWLGPARGENLKIGLNAGLKLLAEKNKGKWLADTKKLGVFGKTDEEWANTDWLPRAVTAGLRKMAFVIPESALGRMTLDAVIRNSTREGLGLESAFFDNLEDARAWLRSA